MLESFSLLTENPSRKEAIQELSLVGVVADGLAAAPSSTGYMDCSDNGINPITVLELLLYNG